MPNPNKPKQSIRSAANKSGIKRSGTRKPMAVKKTERQKRIETACEPVAKDFPGLRDALMDELNLLRANKVSVRRARVVSQLARRIIEASTIDLFAQQLLGDGSVKSLKMLTSENVQGV